MGYKKAATHERDSISGIHVHNDTALKNGEVSVNQLRSLMDSRQAGINDAIKQDWPANMTATDASADHVTYGSAGSRLPRPSDVSSKGADRYGISVSPGKQSPKKPPRSDSKASK